MKSKPKPLPKTHEVAICPMCGLDFPERDAKTEPVYTCAECGIEGFDCCVAGTNTLCALCWETKR